jgi:hypothetical protein
MRSKTASRVVHTQPAGRLSKGDRDHLIALAHAIRDIRREASASLLQCARLWNRLDHFEVLMKRSVQMTAKGRR